MTFSVLDLFCCGGGASAGYYAAGATVLGVDRDPNPDYPFAFVEADALTFLANHGGDFDLIHASPPCQAYAPRGDHGKHADLLGPTIAALESLGKPYVVENVMRAPFDANLVLCGSSFDLRTDVPSWDSRNRWVSGLQLRRHRKFRTTFPVMSPECQHAEPSITMYGKNALSDAHREAMGIPWASEWRTVKEAIPPAFTEHIGHAYAESVQHEEVLIHATSS